MGLITYTHISDACAMVVADYPDTNYGSLEEQTVGFNTGGGGRRRGFIGFPDLPSNPGGPPGTIVDAKLRLRIQAKVDYGKVRGVGIYECDGFNEDTVTWNTQPSSYSLYDSKLYSAISSYSYNYWDITSFIQSKGWSGSGIRMAIMNNPEDLGGGGTDLWGYITHKTDDFWDAPWRPTIIITFEDNPPTPSVLSISPTDVTGQQNTLDWTQNPDSDFQRYELWKRIDGGSWALIHTETVVTNLTYDDPAIVDDGSLCEYFIRTYDISNQINDSNIVSMTKPEILDFFINNLTPILLQTVTGVITSQGGTIVAWRFDWGDGTDEWVGSQNRDHQYSLENTYYTYAQVENSGGWRSTVFTGPTVNVLSLAPIPKLQIYPQVAQPGDTVIANASESFDPDIAGGIDRFRFRVDGDAWVDNGLNPKFYHIFSATGIHTIEVEVRDTGTLTAIGLATVNIINKAIAILTFNFPPSVLDRSKEITYDEESRFGGEGIDITRTGSKGIQITVGAICQGDDGQADIDLLENIINAYPEPTNVQIDIDGKRYSGVMRNLAIRKVKGSPAGTYQWSVSLTCPQPPITI